MVYSRIVVSIVVCLCLIFLAYHFLSKMGKRKKEDERIKIKEKMATYNRSEKEMDERIIKKLIRNVSMGDNGD